MIDTENLNYTPCYYSAIFYSVGNFEPTKYFSFNQKNLTVNGSQEKITCVEDKKHLLGKCFLSYKIGFRVPFLTNLLF